MLSFLSKSGWLSTRVPNVLAFKANSSFFALHACLYELQKSLCFWRWRSREVNSVLVFSCSKRCWQDLLNSLLSPASGDNYHSLMNGRVEYQDIGVASRAGWFSTRYTYTYFVFFSWQFKGTRDKENWKASQTRVGIRSIDINARRQIKIHGNDNLFREE